MSDIDTEELKAYAPIVPYIQKHYEDKIQIKKQGKVAVAKCIWHQEDTASLTFFPNGTYKCFGCGEHGDIITFVQKMENVSFQEACKMIGDNVGYDVVLEEPNPIFESYKDQLDNRSRRYWSNLQQNGEAMRYLICERGISKEMIDLFRLGFTDSEEYKYRSDIGGISNKIVFPILEHKRRNPKCVGMAYRGLTDEKPKNINDPNQEGRENQRPELQGVFIKGNILYGMPMSYNGIASSGHVILVEGYMDVISMHQSGFTNTVGAMGTSLTENQIAEISKVTKNVLLFMDGDKAGENSMLRTIKDLYTQGLNVVICLLDGNMDPADLCKSLDFDNIRIRAEIKSHMMQGIELVINHAVKKYESTVISERTKALREAMPVIDNVQDEAIKEMYKSLLYKRLDIK